MITGTLSPVERLQGLVWDMAHESSYQQELLAEARNWLGGSNATMSVRDPSEPASATFETLVWDSVLLPEYIGRITEEPWLAEGIRRGFHGTVLGSDLVPARAYRKTGFFTDVMGPLDVGDCVTCGVAGHDKVEAFLTVNRGLGQPGFDLDAKRQLRQLQRSFLRSARVMLTRRASLGSQPSVLLSASGLVEADADGLAALQEVGIGGLRSGHVVTGAPALDQRIALWLQGALAGQPEGLFAFAQGVSSRPMNPLRVTMLPERWVSKDWLPRYGARLFVEWEADFLGEIAARYGFTPREHEVLAALIAGSSIGEIAARSQRAESTVRGQVKALFRKTGCRSQAELQRLVQLG